MLNNSNIVLELSQNDKLFKKIFSVIINIKLILDCVETFSITKCHLETALMLANKEMYDFSGLV
ncbi:hypothetical protein HYD96_00890 [Mycoplasmopsis bovis]|nr:hypothetical protein HYD96_00890 [Mycoplasmopsis bovis]